MRKRTKECDQNTNEYDHTENLVQRNHHFVQWFIGVAFKLTGITARNRITFQWFVPSLLSIPVSIHPVAFHSLSIFINIISNFCFALFCFSCSQCCCCCCCCNRLKNTAGVWMKNESITERICSLSSTHIAFKANMCVCVHFSDIPYAIILSMFFPFIARWESLVHYSPSLCLVPPLESFYSFHYFYWWNEDIHWLNQLEYMMTRKKWRKKIIKITTTKMRRVCMLWDYIYVGETNTQKTD